MKDATEQVFTKEYAERKLYPIQEEVKHFMERDGKLYMNVETGGGKWPLTPVSADFISRTEDTALISVVFNDYEKFFPVEVEMKLENGIWKLAYSPYTDNDLFKSRCDFLICSSKHCQLMWLLLFKAQSGVSFKWVALIV